MNNSLHLIAGAATVALTLSNVQGSPVSITDNGYSAENSIGASQTIGNDGYVVFGAYNPSNGNATTADVNPSYVSGGVDIANSVSESIVSKQSYGYTTITVYPTSSTPTPVGTGLALYYSASGTVVTFTLTGTVPSEFQIGLLGDTSPNGGNLSDYTVTDSNSVTATATTVDHGTNGTANNFYFVDISNASSGDVITIQAQTLKNYASIAGITFDTITPAPEPTSLGILGVGALGLLGRRRRSRRPLTNAIACPDSSPATRDSR